mmetsp:Transcript_24426/g.67521  ORF Transcript_24426/g.67521 Transcript_24426/m.67521 type:complete len:88 (+) Transcript_24426:822-1085(+)
MKILLEHSNIENLIVDRLCAVDHELYLSFHLLNFRRQANGKTSLTKEYNKEPVEKTISDRDPPKGTRDRQWVAVDYEPPKVAFEGSQ